MATDDNIVWIDLEMTGLNEEHDKIMEIACIVTDGRLQELARTDNIVIHLPETQLAAMGEWCQDHHGKSGLTQRVRDSTTTMQQAQDQVLAIVRKHCAEKRCPLGGSSNFADRLFLRQQMPDLESYLHYRNVDVSALKEIVKRFNPYAFHRAPTKRNAHRALSDIEDTIDELRYYRDTVLIVDYSNRKPAKTSPTHHNPSDKRREESNTVHGSEVKDTSEDKDVIIQPSNSQLKKMRRIQYRKDKRAAAAAAASQSHEDNVKDVHDNDKKHDDDLNGL